MAAPEWQRQEKGLNRDKAVLGSARTTTGPTRLRQETGGDDLKLLVKALKAECMIIKR